MGDKINGMQYTIFLFVLGIIAFFTGEIVTFVMLGFIVLILTNIYNILKEISCKLSSKKD